MKKAKDLKFKEAIGNNEEDGTGHFPGESSDQSPDRVVENKKGLQGKQPNQQDKKVTKRSSASY